MVIKSSRTESKSDHQIGYLNEFSGNVIASMTHPRFALIFLFLFELYKLSKLLKSDMARFV